MSNIVDLGRVARRAQERAEKKGKEKARKKGAGRRMRTRGEFIQVGATTIGQYLQMLQWSTSKALDPEYIQFLGEACNYQLQCFARAYGWPLDEVEDIPLRFDLSISLDAENQKSNIDFSILGELAEEVSMIISANNEELEVLDNDGR